MYVGSYNVVTFKESYMILICIIFLVHFYVLLIFYVSLQDSTIKITYIFIKPYVYII